MSKVAFIGLGVMGYPMAGHLARRGGHDLTVYNRTGPKAEKWVAEYGGKSAPTPRAAAEGADFVFSCVGNDNDLRAVTLGADGCFGGMKPGEPDDIPGVGLYIAFTDTEGNRVSILQPKGM
jgi:3-hydroxyisobutyrate dehydrogenase-like beta-hydroxyacid dehydrogenase